LFIQIDIKENETVLSGKTKLLHFTFNLLALISIHVCVSEFDKEGQGRPE